MRKRIKDFFNTGDSSHNQLTKSYKMAANADLPPLPTLSKFIQLPSMLSQIHVSSTTTVTPFSETALSTSKNFVPDNKPVCTLLIIF